MSVLNNNVQTFLSEDLTKLVANEIYITMSDTKFPRNQVNVDFHLKEGKMVCSKPWNTQFCFDADGLNHCKSIIDYLGNTNDPTHEEVIAFESWRQNLSKSIESLINDKFRKACLKVVFDIEDIEAFPLQTIRIVDVDITQRPENDKVLVVRKDTPKGINAPPVTSEIMKAYEEGLDVNDFIHKMKENGNLKYKYVTSAEWRKHFYDITVSIMADYTPRKSP
jgi:hypothetical protein